MTSFSLSSALMCPVRLKASKYLHGQASALLLLLRGYPEDNAPNHPCKDAPQFDSSGTSSGISSSHTQARALFGIYRLYYASTSSNIDEPFSLGEPVGASNLSRSVTSGPGPSLEWVFLHFSYVIGIFGLSRSRGHAVFPGVTSEVLTTSSNVCRLDDNVGAISKAFQADMTVRLTFRNDCGSVLTAWLIARARGLARSSHDLPAL